MLSPMNDRLRLARIAAWVLAGMALFLVLALHMLPALLGGLLVYVLVHMLAPLLSRHLSDGRARLVAVALLSILIIGALVALVMLAIAYFRSDAGSLPELARRAAEIIDQARLALPDWLVSSLPAGTEALNDAAVHWLRTHAEDVQLWGKEAARGFAHALLGMVVGALIALRETRPTGSGGPLAEALLERARRLGEAFRRFVFAQVRISAINTFLTGLYLAVLLPLLGIHLPLTKTMIATTFIVGLIPVIGNLISNTIIVVVSLAYSPPVALASLAFLVVIHKLEYFLNAHIVGHRIAARAWELLLAMLTMEAAFGLPGVVAAPIYYAYLKDELRDQGWV